MTLQTKQIVCAMASVALGALTFKAVNDVSGPTFEPILAACTDTSFSTMAEFVERTGYHAYAPSMGLGVFNFLVCLITQFLFELRTTYPEGVLVWGGIMTVAMTYSVMAGIEGGRSHGPLRYPMLMGLLGQLFGISVIIPLIWVPSYILYNDSDGSSSAIPVPPMRSYLSVILTIPNIVLAMIVFTADTNDDLWTVSAGILGGPLLVMSGAIFWLYPPLSASAAAEASNEYRAACTQATQTAYRVAAGMAVVGYWFLVSIAYATYGLQGAHLWDAVWTEANSSVAFMTIDTLVLYTSILSYVAYKDLNAAKKAFLLTPFVGPAAASFVLAELEKTTVVPKVETKQE